MGRKSGLTDFLLRSDIAVLIALALIKLLIHFLFNGQYGYFRDELYYMACGKNLAFGYVDQPPFVALVVRFSRWFLGDSLFALRFFPAVASALVVFMTGMIVRELGGKRFAQALAALGVILSGIILALGNFLSMNPFDHLFWILAAYVLVLILKNGQLKLWVLLGVVLGLGLQNKYSMVFFGFGLVAGLLLTSGRKYFLKPGIWLAGIVALVIFLPNLIWQFRHEWPTLEFIRNASLYKNVDLSPLEFLSGQILEMNPVLFPLLLIGLLYYLFSRSGKLYRVFGWMYLAIFVLFIMTRAKIYYLAPIYPIMFSGGALAVEKFIMHFRWNWLKPAIVSLLIIGSLPVIPFALPILPVESYIKYSAYLGIAPPPEERHEMGKLPQHYADMFGWENMAATVAKVYERLTSEEKAKCGIFAQNYGEAGAIDFFGKKYGLPQAISGHNNYWIWGPRHYTGEIIIMIGGNLENYGRVFQKIEQVAMIRHEYVMPHENNLPVYLCRGLTMPIKEIWPRLKHYD